MNGVEKGVRPEINAIFYLLNCERRSQIEGVFKINFNFLDGL